jgi:hypothetical protein
MDLVAPLGLTLTRMPRGGTGGGLMNLNLSPSLATCALVEYRDSSRPRDGVVMRPVSLLRLALLNSSRSLTYLAFKRTCPRMACDALVRTFGPALLMATRTASSVAPPRNWKYSSASFRLRLSTSTW